MNIKEIDKWLDNEYGVSYTRLEELHDFFFEKYTNLNCILTELEEWLNLEISIHDEDDTIDKLYSCVLDKIQELRNKYEK